MFDLTGQTALVTGAGSGLGVVFSQALAEAGAAVVCADVNLPAVTETARMIEGLGGQALPLDIDVTDEQLVAVMIARTLSRFGRLDIVVNNAGVAAAGPPEALTLADWRRVVDVNLTGVFLVARAAAREMIAGGRGGRIITMASIGGLVGIDSGVDYNMTKHAVVGLTRTLARQLAKHAITVNAICPGYVRTSMNRPIWDTPERLARVAALTPLPRLGEVDDVAGAAFFLASDDAAWVTGVALPVDGGYTAI
jgi:NAD(P)-dependent dehydrogenase (short-subunit alcohol dehydrogenase family)